MQTQDQLKNHKIREAQNAMWALEDDKILTREEILKVTGMLQSKKVMEE